MEKKHYAGIFIILLVIPTIFLLQTIVPIVIVYILASLEIMIGVSVFRIKKERIEKNKFWLLIIILFIFGLFVIAIATGFPIWARIFFK